MIQIELKKNAIAEVIEREGGSKFTNRAADRGRATRWGVTEANMRRMGWTGDAKDFPYDLAYKFYELVWDECRCDDLATFNPDLTIYVFDFAVHSNAQRAGNRLQRVLNVLNNRGKLYPDITVDGDIGSQTLASLAAFARIRGEGGLRMLAEVFKALRIGLCFDLAEKSEDQEENATGWFNRICSL